MTHSYWKSYELKSLGIHPRTVKAILRIQRKEIYSNEKQELLKIKIAKTLCLMGRKKTS